MTTVQEQAACANRADAEQAEVVLDVRGLSTTFFTDLGSLKAVDDVSFQLRRGEILGIVGESGSGKTVTSKSIMRLIPDPPGKITDGEILYDGLDLAQATEKQMQRIRGNKIAMIFQEPMTALNPVFTIGWQIEEALALHQPELSRRDRKQRALQMLEKVGIPDAKRRVSEYPHQLSGGMRQRAMIAIALSCKPDILIADEPTTALDVTIQAQVLRLIEELRDELNTAVILITHDLGVVAEICDRVCVMYAARVIEQGSVQEVFHSPAHPYTRMLMRSIPKKARKVPGAKLETIPGMVPQLNSLPSGCRFRGRCDKETDSCATAEPTLAAHGENRMVRCWSPEQAISGAISLQTSAKRDV